MNPKADHAMAGEGSNRYARGGRRGRFGAGIYRILQFNRPPTIIYALGRTFGGTSLASSFAAVDSLTAIHIRAVHERSRVRG
jgi:hypothetical protein